MSQMPKLLKSELAALRSEELVRLNVDVRTAVQTIQTALPRLRALRAELLAGIPGFDIEHLDSLESYVLALEQAEMHYRSAERPSPRHHRLLAKLGIRLRDRILTDVRCLVAFGHLEADTLGRLKRGNGYYPLAANLEFLSATLRAAWPRISTRARTSEGEIRAAAVIADTLRRPCVKCAEASEDVAEAGELRRRAFTLLLRSYEEVRAAVAYIRRREGDFESIAPTLYSRGGRPPMRVARSA